MSDTRRMTTVVSDMPSFRDLETEVAEITDVSCHDGNDQLEYLGLSHDQSGQRILDVASGASSFVERLRGRGAIAFGIDPAYSDTSRMERDAEKYITENAAGNPLWLTENRRTRLDSFMYGIDEKVGYYAAASALRLPFPDGTFDKVFNQAFLASHAGTVERFVAVSVCEAMRVLRPRGTFYTSPVFDTAPPAEPEKAEEVKKIKANLNAAFELAKDHKLIDKVSKINIARGLWIYVATKPRR